MCKRFRDRKIGILQLNVFTHKPDCNFVGGIFQLFDKGSPIIHIGFRNLSQIESHFRQYYLIEFFGLHIKRNTIDSGRINGLQDRFRLDVAKQGYFFAHFGRNVVFGAKHKNIGLYSLLLKSFYGVLCGFCL